MKPFDFEETIDPRHLQETIAVSKQAFWQVNSNTVPNSPMWMFRGFMPMDWASLLWICKCRCSPWTGRKNRGLTRAWMIFSSSWQAWPET